jgi:hypothetical protein
MIATMLQPSRRRVIVDPFVAHDEEIFERMMARFESMTDEEHLQFGIEHGYLHPDGSLILPEGDPCVTPLHPTTFDRRTRVIVDPVVAADEEVFERMMARFDSMTDEEHLQFGIEHGYLRPDGSLILSEGDPCVTRV